MYQLTILKPNIQSQIINVSTIPQRSPFRFPGGKTWLVPTVRKWLSNYDTKKITLVEPFAGGGIISLTAAFEDLAKRIIMIELDKQVAAVWKTIFSEYNKNLADKIINFELSINNAKEILEKESKNIYDIAFATILRNRIYHGGIITRGSGLMKNGENGNGIKSRWYPETLYNRIREIEGIKQKISFFEGDAFKFINKYIKNNNFLFFIDPPYTIAGKRLYTHFDIDHEKLFYLASNIKGHYMMTYDDTDEIRRLATKYNLPFFQIPMKTTHNINKYELIITDCNQLLG